MYPDGVTRVDQGSDSFYLFRDELIMVTRSVGDFHRKVTLVGLTGNSASFTVPASAYCALVDVYLPQAVASRKVLVAAA